MTALQQSLLNPSVAAEVLASQFGKNHRNEGFDAHGAHGDGVSELNPDRTPSKTIYK